MIKSLAAERCAPVLILLDHLSHLERNLTSFMKKKWNSSIRKCEQKEFWAKENEDASEVNPKKIGEIVSLTPSNHFFSLYGIFKPIYRVVLSHFKQILEKKKSWVKGKEQRCIVNVYRENYQVARGIRQ